MIDSVRTNISLPRALVERIAAARRLAQINVSAVCAAALAAEVERIEQEAWAAAQLPRVFLSL